MRVFAPSTLALVLASLLDGSTSHQGAFVLRALVVVLWLALPPVAQHLMRGEFVAPALATLAIALSVLGAPPHGVALQPILSVAAVILTWLWSSGARPAARAAVLHALAAVGVVQTAWAMGELVATRTLRGRGSFFNPNDLAALLAPLAVLACAWALTAAREQAPGRRTVAYTAVAVLLALGVLATGSRSGALALAVAGGVLALGASRHWKRALVLACLVGASGAAVFALRARADANDPFAFSRSAIWRSSVELALQHPMGVGLGGFAEAMREHGVPLDGPLRFPRTAHHAHSEPLNAWVELGLLGLLTTLLAPGALAWRLWRTRARKPRLDTARDLAVLAALGIPAALSASLHVPIVALTAAVWAGQVTLECRQASNGQTPSAEEPGWTLTGSARGVLTTLAVLCLLLAAPGLVEKLALGAAQRTRDAGDIARSLAHAELAATVAPSSVPAVLMLESLRYAGGAPALEVTERLASLADQHPRDPRPVERAAWVLEAALPHATEPARVSQWLVTLRRAQAERDPRSAMAWLALAQALDRTGEASQARAAYERALAEEPQCAPALAWLALVAHEQGDTALAQELGQRALAGETSAKRYGALGAALLTLPVDVKVRLRGLLAGH